MTRSPCSPWTPTLNPHRGAWRRCLARRELKLSPAQSELLWARLLRRRELGAVSGLALRAAVGLGMWLPARDRVLAQRTLPRGWLLSQYAVLRAEGLA